MIRRISYSAGINLRLFWLQTHARLVHVRDHDIDTNQLIFYFISNIIMSLAELIKKSLKFLIVSISKLIQKLPFYVADYHGWQLELSSKLIHSTETKIDFDLEWIHERASCAACCYLPKLFNVLYTLIRVVAVERMRASSCEC